MFKIFYNFKFLFVITLSIFALSALESRADVGEDLVISTNTTWEAGEYTYRDITITNNATLTLNGAYTDNDNGVGVTINARNITVDAGSAIFATATGYAGCAGPGAGTSGDLAGRGGSYGGRGGGSLTDLTYGSALNPNNLGSGGCTYQSDAAKSGKGGGAITIIASDQVSVSGSITANGGNGLAKTGGYPTGGGSGGTVNISTTSITGTGNITANGGNGYNNGGVGGGGRISIYYSSGSLSNLTILATKGVTGDVTSATDGTVFPYNRTTRDLVVAASLNLKPTEGIDENGSVTADGEYYFNDLIISNNSTLTLGGTHTNDSDGDGVGINLAGDLSVESGSTITATGKGYSAQSGPGKGSVVSTFGGSGGGYGGEGDGVQWTGYGGTGGATYGSTLFPEDLGSGGGQSCGGLGGGLVKVIADGDINIDGAISANGTNGGNSGSYRGGGGSGGSVYIVGGAFTGTGTITANGGNGTTSGYGGGGGGGRIALYYASNVIDTNNFIVDAGTDSQGRPATAGTIFLYNTTTGDVEVSQDVTFEGNAGVSRDGSKRTDGIYYFNNLIVSNNATVTVSGYWTGDGDGRGVTINLDGDLIVDSGSTINASGGGYTAQLGLGRGLQGDGNASGGGGSYGGTGGSGAFGGTPGSVYGDNEKYYPYFLGSGGGNCNGGVGGVGGGAVAIRSLGDVIINGDVLANGSDGGFGSSGFGSGGGSGGSIFLSGNSFSGLGYIKANGGNGGAADGGGGAGGGGRISIAYFDTFAMNTDNITADGGVGSITPDRDGTAGTIYIRKMDLPLADFDLVNPNNNSKQYTNSLTVGLDPEDSDADEYYESSNSDLPPTFYAPGWHKISEGKQLSAGEGVKTVKAWIKDNNQLISSAVGEATIILDQTKPILSVLQAGDTETTSDRIKISGTVADALSGVEYVVINGQQISGFVCAGPNILEGELVAIQDGSFEADINLGMGVNSITIVAYDRAGNSTTTSMNITRVASSEGDSSDDSPEDFNSYSEQPVSLSATPVHTIAPSHYIDSESDSIDFDKVDQDNDGDFSRDSDKLIFYRNDPTISGQSQPNALIEIILDNDRFQTDADIQGYWSYTFNNLSSGIHNLTINEYMRSGELIRSSSYVMEILNGAALQDDQEKTPLVKWWWLLIFLILILVSYWYYRKKFAKK